MKEKEERLLRIWKKVQVYCCFIPTVTTLAFVTGAIFDFPKGTIGESIVISLVIIGWGAALLVGPHKLLVVLAAWIRTNGLLLILLFSIAICFRVVDIVIATLMGILLAFPAVLTIPCYFSRKCENTVYKQMNNNNEHKVLKQNTKEKNCKKDIQY